MRLNPTAINKAITSVLFWATCRAAAELCYEAEFVGRFAEGCWCHQDAFEEHISCQAVWSREAKVLFREHGDGDSGVVESSV